MESKVPMRKCVGCGKMKPKSQLFRVVKNDGSVVVDLTMKTQCRGAYICKNSDCVLKAQKRKGLNRGLKTSISDTFFDELLKECE